VQPDPPPRQPHFARSAPQHPAWALAWQHEPVGAGRGVQCGQPAARAGSWGPIPRLPKSLRLRKSTGALSRAQPQAAAGRVCSGTSAAASQAIALPKSVSNQDIETQRDRATGLPRPGAPRRSAQPSDLTSILWRPARESNGNSATPCPIPGDLVLMKRKDILDRARPGRAVVLG